jgi:5-methylcytosine-specific restriction endonuclease McrA
MTSGTFKRPRLRLDPKSYKKLWKQILDRDGWRCQQCGSQKNLQVHHIQFRSRLGNDQGDNLITLCAVCHKRLHSYGTLDP